MTSDISHHTGVAIDEQLTTATGDQIFFDGSSIGCQAHVVHESTVTEGSDIRVDDVLWGGWAPSRLRVGYGSAMGVDPGHPQVADHRDRGARSPRSHRPYCTTGSGRARPHPHPPARFRSSVHPRDPGAKTAWTCGCAQRRTESGFHNARSANGGWNQE